MTGGAYCSTLGCINKYTKGGISFHEFPKDPDVRSYWIEACRRQNWIPKKSSVVCSDHFHKNDYEIMKPGKKKPKLKPGAVPSRMKRPDMSRESKITPKYECIKCAISFDYVKELQNHVVLVHGSAIHHKGAPAISAQPFTCSQCKSEYASESDLKHHITLKHSSPSEMEIDLPTMPATLHTCSQCVAAYCSENDLKQHNIFAHGSVPCNNVELNQVISEELAQHKESVHEKLKLFKCEECSHETYSKIYLNIHMKKAHKKIVDNVCNQCDSAFYDQRCLRRHKSEVHFSIRDQLCSYCGATFARKEKLTKHMESVHEKVKNFKCDKCPYSAYSKIFLNIHIRKVHERIKDKVCEQCDSAFYDQSSLERHKREVHQSFRSQGMIVQQRESNDNDFLRKKCEFYRKKLAEKRKNDSKLRAKLFRNIKSNKRKQCCVDTAKKEGNKANTWDATLEKRYSGPKLNIMKDILQKSDLKKRPKSYSQETKDFAIGIHYRSPATYKYLRKTFSLPCETTIREMLGSDDCYPGFQRVAFDELKSRSNDIAYKDVALSFDAMKLKEVTQYDPKLGRVFGFVDYGGESNLSSGKKLAKDALCVMAVGLRKFWKVPLAYFNINGIDSEVLSGIVKEALNLCHESGVNARSVAMDGTITNIASYDKLGCKMQPKKISQMVTSFQHPHKDASHRVYAYPDPGHMAKNTRNLLAEYKNLWWPGKGWVQWKYVVALQELQNDHAFLVPAHKLTGRHINFHKNKMKWCLALQVMSDSVARALRWCHNIGEKGFESKDVLATADFLELHDKVFDVMNSRSKYGSYYKAALSKDNIERTKKLFKNFSKMYESLEMMPQVPRAKGKKVLKSRRKTGPLGFIACTKSLLGLFEDMQSGNLDLEYLCTYKLTQDHLEHFFSAIRLRGGWRTNPSPLEFRFAFRKLLYGAGKSVLANLNGNCTPQDNTTMLCASANERIAHVSMSDAEKSHDLSEDDLPDPDIQMCDTGCLVNDCRYCSGTISYIAGFFVYSLEKKLKCKECIYALQDVPDDICYDRSLIYAKNYVHDVPGRGLKFPSGSLCRLLLHCEKVFRKHLNLLHDKKFAEKMLINVLDSLNQNVIFPALSLDHQFNTQVMSDNHYTSLIQLISEKYIRLRALKLLKLMSDHQKEGNYISRIRVFKGL